MNRWSIFRFLRSDVRRTTLTEQPYEQRRLPSHARKQRSTHQRSSTMGRSQVLRNRTHGRPGQGRGRGRDGGAYGRGCGRGRGRSSSRSQPDPRTLGDNAFRYERSARSSDDDGRGVEGDDSYYGVMDDIHFMSSISGFGEYHGPSHFDDYTRTEDEELIVQSTIMASLSLSEKKEYSSSHGHGTTDFGREGEDYYSIDISALAKCLSQVPIHERLGVPWHVGKHLQNMYGSDNAGSSRKKTLAELREESKWSDGTMYGGTDGQTRDKHDLRNDGSLPIHDGGAKKVENSPQLPLETAQCEGRKDDTNVDASEVEGEDDLDAWLDDMIS